jgi:glycine C-acetyltransferase
MASKVTKFLQTHLAKELQAMKEGGTYKAERIITSPQLSEINANGKTVLNFCANNYLGLSNNARLIQAAKKTLDTHGFGMSSVRFICGTQDIHKQLEKVIADYYNLEDTILFPSGFDANAGFF